MGKFKVLVIDDQESKKEELEQANQEIGRPLEIVFSEEFEQLFNDEELRVRYPEFAKKTFAAITKALQEDPHLKAVLLDLDLTNLGTLDSIYNELNEMLGSGITIFDLFRFRMPYLIVWTHHSLDGAPQGGAAAWRKILTAHGVDYICDGEGSVQNLVENVVSRLQILDQKRRSQKELLYKQFRKDIESFPAVVLFADIEGYTGLFQKYGDDHALIASLVDDALRVCGEAVTRYGGVIHKPKNGS